MAGGLGWWIDRATGIRFETGPVGRGGVRASIEYRGVWGIVRRFRERVLYVPSPAGVPPKVWFDQGSEIVEQLSRRQDRNQERG